MNNEEIYCEQCQELIEDKPLKVRRRKAICNIHFECLTEWKQEERTSELIDREERMYNESGRF